MAYVSKHIFGEIISFLVFLEIIILRTQRIKDFFSFGSQNNFSVIKDYIYI